MKYFAYITAAGDDKILRFAMDPDNGALQKLEEITIPGAPSPLATDPQQRFLYAGLRSSNEIASFTIDPQTGGLSHLGTIPLDSNPCYLATDRSGRFMLAAYYHAGQVTVHAIGENGAVEAPALQTVPTAEHAHCIETDRANRFAFVPHTMPANAIFQFRFDAATGRLSPNAVPKVEAEPGAGPRHFVFHPSRDLVYTSNENGSSTTAYHFDAQAGTLSPFQTLSTLPADFRGENTCAQIHIHPTGRFLYVSNRGHDSIACFAIDEATGRLKALGQAPTEPIPRVFNLDPTGQFLYAAGQESGRLASYRVHPTAGTLTRLETYTVGERPMWVMILGFGE